MSLIAVYRDFSKGLRFHLRATRQTEALGYLLKGLPGRVPVIERYSVSGYVSATGDGDDTANVQLVRTDTNGNPVTPVLEATVTAGTSTTVFDTGLAMTLNAHANRWAFFRTGANAGKARKITSNTVGGQITLTTAVGTTPVAGETFSILPANAADAAWGASTQKVIVPAQRLTVRDIAQTFNITRKVEIPLGVGEGIGWFSTLHDNFASTTDLIQFAELCINVEGRIEGSGYRSASQSFFFQPSGGVS